MLAGPVDTPTQTSHAAELAAPLGAHLAVLEQNPLIAGLGPEAFKLFASYLEVVSFPAGEIIVQEAAAGQEMYFLLTGEAELRRARVDLGRLGPGAHFGELALIARRLRAASIAAVTPVTLARLSRPRYEAMSAKAPALALRFTQALVGSLGSRLTEMTDSVGLLLHERSLPRRVEVEARIGGEARRVKTGTALQALLPARLDGLPVIAALLNNKAVSLDAPVTSDAIIAPLTTAHWEGKRVYRTSLALLLLEAARRADPAVPLRMGPSIGYAQWVERVSPAEGEGPAPEIDRVDLARRITREMRAMIAEDVPFRQELWTVEEARSHFEERGQADVARLLRTTRSAAVPLATAGETYLLGMTPLAPSAGRIASFPFRFCADGEAGFGAPPNGERWAFLLHYGDEEAVPPAAGGRAGPAEGCGAPAAGVPDDLSPGPQGAGKAIHGEEPWLRALGVTSVGAFNEACIAGSVSQIIRVSEGLHEKRIGQIADAIAGRAGRVRVICIAGPSSSGKSTFIKRLTVQLQVNGVSPVGISLDDYYLDRERTAKDARGEYDFEAPEALDMELMRGQIRRLLDGERVTLARYDFSTGRSLPSGGPTIALRGSDVLLLEGIHGLNHRLFAPILERSEVFRVFIQPATGLPFDRLSRVNVSDLRLLRRIVRDRHQRGINAAENIRRWPAVRAGERAHIFPFLGEADAVFDSALVYEPSVLKVFADRYLLEVPQDHPSFVTAHRLRLLLDRFITIYPDHVPPTSILREFIGGSGFEY
ncbi:MAG: cyclic nucleotide-binding domain-containing protein [Polyangiaceae bacterium]|nr:cyclic nucleotide-binding domain-containing protein [Polyangiaceae bacterium]